MNAIVVIFIRRLIVAGFLVLLITLVATVNNLILPFSVQHYVAHKAEAGCPACIPSPYMPRPVVDEWRMPRDPSIRLTNVGICGVASCIGATITTNTQGTYRYIYPNFSPRDSPAYLGWRR